MKNLLLFSLLLTLTSFTQNRLTRDQLTDLYHGLPAPTPAQLQLGKEWDCYRTWRHEQQHQWEDVAGAFIFFESGEGFYRNEGSALFNVSQIAHQAFDKEYEYSLKDGKTQFGVLTALKLSTPALTQLRTRLAITSDNKLLAITSAPYTNGKETFDPTLEAYLCEVTSRTRNSFFLGAKLGESKELNTKSEHNQILPLSNSKFLVVTTKKSDLSLTRYLQSGEVDKGFGKLGTLNLALPETSDVAYSGFNPDMIQELDDSSLVIKTLDMKTHELKDLYRIDSNGKFDQKFGVNGRFRVPNIENVNNKGLQSVISDHGELFVDYQHRALATQHMEGKGVICNSSDPEMLSFHYIKKFKSNGQIDKSFGALGTADLALMIPKKSLGDFLCLDQSQLLPAKDGGLFVIKNIDLWAEERSQRVIVFKLDKSGKLDTNYSKDGIALINLELINKNPSETYFRDSEVIVDSKDRLVFSYIFVQKNKNPFQYVYQLPGDQTVSFVRMKMGALDSSFGDNGVLSLLAAETGPVSSIMAKYSDIGIGHIRMQLRSDDGLLLLNRALLNGEVTSVTMINEDGSKGQNSSQWLTHQKYFNPFFFSSGPTPVSSSQANDGSWNVNLYESDALKLRIKNIIF